MHFLLPDQQQIKALAEEATNAEVGWGLILIVSICDITISKDIKTIES